MKKLLILLFVLPFLFACTDDTSSSSEPAPTPVVEPAGPVCGNGVLEEGEECDDGKNNGKGRCTSSCTLKPMGCTSDQDCSSGQICDTDNHTCETRYAKLGESCESCPCESGLYCSSAKRCEKEAHAIGEPCTMDSDCISGLCKDNLCTSN